MMNGFLILFQAWSFAPQVQDVQPGTVVQVGFGTGPEICRYRIPIEELEADYDSGIEDPRDRRQNDGKVEVVVRRRLFRVVVPAGTPDRGYRLAVDSFNFANRCGVPAIEIGWHENGPFYPVTWVQVLPSAKPAHVFVRLHGFGTHSVRFDYTAVPELTLVDGDFYLGKQKWQLVGMNYDRPPLPGQPVTAVGAMGNAKIGEILGRPLPLPSNPQEQIVLAAEYDAENDRFNAKALSFFDEVLDNPSLVKRFSDEYHGYVARLFQTFEAELVAIRQTGVNAISMQLSLNDHGNPEKYLPLTPVKGEARNLLPPHSRQTAIANFKRFAEIAFRHGLRIELALRDGARSGLYRPSTFAEWPYADWFPDPSKFDGRALTAIADLELASDPLLRNTVLSLRLADEPYFLFNYGIGFHHLYLQDLDWFYFDEKFGRNPRDVSYGEYINSYYRRMAVEWEAWLLEQYGSISAAEAQFGAPNPNVLKAAQSDLVAWPHANSATDIAWPTAAFPAFEEGLDDVVQSDPELCFTHLATPRILAFRRFADDFTGRQHVRVAYQLREADPHHYITSKVTTDHWGFCLHLPYNTRALAHALDFLPDEFYSGSAILLRYAFYPWNGLIPAHNCQNIPWNGQEVSLGNSGDRESPEFARSRDAMSAVMTFLSRYPTFNGRKPLVSSDGGYWLRLPHDGAENSLDPAVERRRQADFYHAFFHAFDQSDTDGAFAWLFYPFKEAHESFPLPCDPPVVWDYDYGFTELTDSEGNLLSPTEPHLNFRQSFHEFTANAPGLTAKQERYPRNVTVVVDETLVNNLQDLFFKKQMEIYTLHQNGTPYVEVRSAGRGRQSTDSGILTLAPATNPRPAVGVPSAPLKYFNAEFNELLVRNAAGEWQNVLHEPDVMIRPRQPVLAKVSVGNNQEGIWKVKNVKLTVAHDRKPAAMTYPLPAETPPLQDALFQDIEVWKPAPAPVTSVPFRPVAVALRLSLSLTQGGDRGFGETLRFTLRDPDAYSLFDAFNRQNTQEIGPAWDGGRGKIGFPVPGVGDTRLVPDPRSPNRFVIEDGMLTYGKHGSNFVDPAPENGVGPALGFDEITTLSPVMGFGERLEFDLRWSQGENAEFGNAKFPCENVLGSGPANGPGPWIDDEPEMPKQTEVTRWYLTLLDGNGGERLRLESRVVEWHDRRAGSTTLAGSLLAQAHDLKVPNRLGALGYRQKQRVSLRISGSNLALAVDGTPVASVPLGDTAGGEMRLRFGMDASVAAHECRRDEDKPSDYAGFQIDDLAIVPRPFAELDE